MEVIVLTTLDYGVTTVVLPTENYNVLENVSNDTIEIDLSASADIHEEISFYIAVLLLSLCVFGVLGNVLSVYVFSRPVMMQQSINVLLTALSTIDALLLLLVGPTFSLPAIRTKLQLPSSGSMQLMLNACTLLLYPSALVLQTASVWLFVVISYERYFAVCMPLQAGVYCTRKRAKIAVAAILLASVVYNGCRYFEYQPGESYTDPLHERLRAEPLYILWYITVAYVLLNYTLPLLCIAGLNWRVMGSISEMRRERRKSLGSDVRGEHSTARMMIIVIVIFAACYSLSAVLAVVDTVYPDFYRGEHATLAFTLLDLNNALVVVNSTSSALVYYAFSARYRTVAKSTAFIACPPLARLVMDESKMEHFIEDRDTRQLGYARDLRKSLRMAPEGNSATGTRSLLVPARFRSFPSAEQTFAVLAYP